ncbi:MAG: hypothetical protein Kow00129_07310 [Thermoleophilia bacterium]
MTKPKLRYALTVARQGGGFTLVEVMVAALLLLLVLIPALGMMISSVQAALQSETQNAASLLAQEQIEELRTYEYDALYIDSSKLTSANVTALGLSGTAPDYTYTYGTTPQTYVYLHDTAGTIEPVETVRRRNVYFTIHRYILEIPSENHRKILVRISWTSPQTSEVVFETDIQEIGFSGNRPPVVNILHPYYGDAFTEWREITPSGGADLKATVTDADGTPQDLVFQYKKNIDASFSFVANGVKAANPSGGYDYTADWTTTITAEDQYNFRAVVQDDEGAVSVETIPFFLDVNPPHPPGTVAVTGSDGSTGDPKLWPVRLVWTPVYEFIASNSNFNMVSGYIIYRDSKPLGGDDDSITTGTSPIATIYGADNNLFFDTAPLDSDSEYRYRIKSMGRAEAWRSTKLSSVGEQTTPWFTVGQPVDAGHDFTTFTAHSEAPSGYELYAVATSWSAIEINWVPQADSAGHRATIYVVERKPNMDGADQWGLVSTVWDPPSSTLTNLAYEDRNLERNTTYEYRVTPYVHLEQAPTSIAAGLSEQVTTDIY